MVVEIYQRGPEVWEQRAFSAATPWLVFDYVADFPRHVEWERDLLSVKVFGHGPGVLGAEYLKTYGKPAKGPVGRMFNRAQLLHNLPPELRGAAGRSAGDRPGRVLLTRRDRPAHARGPPRPRTGAK